jgi:hypothetical protein
MIIYFYWIGSDADDPIAVRDWPTPPVISAQVHLRVAGGVYGFVSVDGRVVEVRFVDTCDGRGAAIYTKPCAAVTLERVGVIA